MNTVQKIAKNTGVLLASRIIGSLLSFFYMMYIARYLGPKDYGVLSFALALTALYAVFTDFGLQSLTIREVSKHKALAPKYLSNLSGMKIVLVLGTLAMIAITISLMGFPAQTKTVIYLVALSVMVNSFIIMFYAIFQAYERMEYQGIGQMLNSLVMFCGVIVGMKFDFSVVGFAALYFLTSLIIVTYSYTILKIKLPSSSRAWSICKIEFDVIFWKDTIKQALPFGLAISFVVIFYWVDSVMLSIMKGDEVVGWYNAAYRLVLCLLIVPGSFIAAIYPIMANYHMTSKDSVEVIFAKSLKYLTILGIPLGVGTTLLARKIILLIFGMEYVESIFPLQILIWSSVLIFMSQPFGNLFNSINKQAIVTKIAGSCVAVNVILNLILIPKHSLAGASIATVITELLSLICHVAYTERMGYLTFNGRFVSIVVKLLIANIALGFIVFYLRNLTLLAIIPLAVLLYLLILWTIKVMTTEDINLFKIILQR